MPRDQVLVSLPPAMADQFATLENRGTDYFAGYDPGQPLGSGGGTCNLLVQAWKASDSGLGFRDWMHRSRKIVIHSGGQSRRLPAYAATGKALIPVPIERGSLGQKFDQTLLDLQLEALTPVLREASPEFGLVVLSGDVLLRIFGEMPRIESADIACLGFSCSPQELQGHGAFFCRWETPAKLDFAIQKPRPAETLEWRRHRKCLADAGVWLLNERAVDVLMQLCGWNEEHESFEGTSASALDLYGEFGLTLGESPTQLPASGGKLSATIFQPDCRFFHFGTSRQVLEAGTRLHQLSSKEHSSGMGFLSSELRHANQHVQNVDFEGGQNLPQDLSIWIENAYISKGISFSGQNFVTGLPEKDWKFHLPSGGCLEVAPIGETGFCLRCYGFDDSFSGPVGAISTKWMGAPVSRWFEARGMCLSTEVADVEADIQATSLFPCVPATLLDSGFISWLLEPEPVESDEFRERWKDAKKVSARDLLSETNVARVYAQRKRLQMKSLRAVVAKRDRNMFYTMDIERAAQLAAVDAQFPEVTVDLNVQSPAQAIRDFMFESEMLRLRGKADWEDLEARAFRLLRNMIVDRDRLAVESPISNVLAEQIVWGRSPIRLDLAGGWTDTPPFSILHGGRVVNVAVELNGQPSVQVFARVTDTPEIVLRSIDLGTQVVLKEFDDLRTDVTVGSEFALAKTALSLAGFSPDFCLMPAANLAAQLRTFGGGIELSMLAAIPKGSGLGTSSVLSSTLLATIGSICGRNWTDQDVFTRVLASEQILTTGGGWQDQIGGALPGLKLVTSESGVAQNVKCYWLPHAVLGHEVANRTALLYYTGITRTAKGVLREIVRGMFMNSQATVNTLREIGENTRPTTDAIMRNSYQGLGEAVRKSWDLNRALDSGTCPPAVDRIYSLVDDYVFGAKLLGAGGGGYMLMLCKDEKAAKRVRSILGEEQIHPGSRFVNFEVSPDGLVVTRS